MPVKQSTYCGGRYRFAPEQAMCFTPTLACSPILGAPRPAALRLRLEAVEALAVFRLLAAKDQPHG
jgi:hypothetical protein